MLPGEVQAAVLPAGVLVSQGPAQAPPSSYEEGEYVLPAHSEKPLSKLNRNPLDDHLKFFERDHIYTYKGVPLSSSVTPLAHSRAAHFDPEAAAALLPTSRSQAYPRAEYVFDLKNGEETWRPDRGALLVAAGKTVAALPPNTMRSCSSVESMREALVACTKKGLVYDEEFAHVCTYSRAMTKDEIVASWARKGKLASNMGTEGHWLAECFFNGLPTRWWEGEMKAVLEFARDYMVPRGIVAWATEKEIVCEDADVAGSVDLICYDPNVDMYHIIDFKRSDKLQSSLRGYGKMTGEFKHLDDCKCASYALQTSLYQYILEREYGMKIGDRILLSIHPDAPFATSVPFLHAEVDYLMQERFALVRSRKRVAEESPRFTCSLTGAPAFGAVVLKDSQSVAMENAALVRGLSYDVAEDIRAEFDGRVSELMKEESSAVKLDTAACTPWRKLVPASGLDVFAGSSIVS